MMRLGGDNPAITFPDNTTQSTAGLLDRNPKIIEGGLTFADDTVQNTAAIPTNPLQLAKAWVHFNAQTGTIISSFNVASIDYIAADNFKLHFATPMANANYAVIGNCSTPTGFGIIFDGLGTNAVDSYEFQTGYVVNFGAGLTMTNYTKNYLAFFGE